MKSEIVELIIHGRPTRIRHLGQGRPLFVFPGGPGLSGSYFDGHLLELSRTRRLTIFDPLGCGGSRAEDVEATARATLEHATSVFNEFGVGQDLEVLAHSWGTYLLAGVLAGTTRSISRLTLTNPVPPSRVGFNATGAALVGRVPLSVAEEIGRLAEQNDDYSGREMMRRALPYYSGRSGNLPDLYFEYHNDTYNTVLDTAGDYELTAALEDASIPTRMIFGSTDHITPDLFRDFVGPRLRASPAITIDGGHFAFADSPTAFCDAVLST